LLAPLNLKADEATQLEPEQLSGIHIFASKEAISQLVSRYQMTKTLLLY
jgi:hypothetical protein